MNEGKFLVSLREVLNTERILNCRCLFKENINFWEEGFKPVQKNDNSILLGLAWIKNTWTFFVNRQQRRGIQNFRLSQKIIKRFNVKCVPSLGLAIRVIMLHRSCIFVLVSREGLTVLSGQMADFVFSLFLLDDADKVIADIISPL